MFDVVSSSVLVAACSGQLMKGEEIEKLFFIILRHLTRHNPIRMLNIKVKKYGENKIRRVTVAWHDKHLNKALQSS
jgi:hypothetical protein